MLIDCKLSNFVTYFTSQSTSFKHHKTFNSTSKTTSSNIEFKIYGIALVYLQNVQLGKEFEGSHSVNFDRLTG